MKYIKRLLGLPFYMGLLAIGMIWQFVLKSFLWMKYGGEAVNYNDKMNRKTISDVFYKLQDK
jgi:hypothetical protein